jgi:hypothetical protein
MAHDIYNMAHGLHDAANDHWVFTFCVHQIELHAHCYSCAKFYKPNFAQANFFLAFMLVWDICYSWTHHLQDNVIYWF